MIPTGEWLNPTRAVGLLAYGTATVCCGIARTRAKSRRQNGRLSVVLMLIEAVLLLDITFNWRWILHQRFVDLAQRTHEYGVRRPPQVILLVVLTVLLLGGMFAVQLYFRGRGRALAVSGGLLSLFLWCTEVVSLHQVDHVLYHRVGPLMTVGLLWMAACLMTSSGILMASLDAGHKRERV